MVGPPSGCSRSCGCPGVLSNVRPKIYGTCCNLAEDPRKQLVHAGVGLLVVIALSPVLVWTYAYWDRAAGFPSLLQFLPHGK